MLAVLALATTTVLTGASADANQPYSATALTTTHKARVIKVKVDRHLFGVHDHNWNSLHRKGTGGIRLWDSGTMWADLFPTMATPNWTRLDAAVRAAHANGTEVTLVLGLSPSYAASTPTGAPDPALYNKYVRAVMNRYRPAHWGYRGIANYQVWNEANIATFWTGTRPRWPTSSASSTAPGTRSIVAPRWSPPRWSPASSTSRAGSRSSTPSRWAASRSGSSSTPSR